MLFLSWCQSVSVYLSKGEIEYCISHCHPIIFLFLSGSVSSSSSCYLHLCVGCKQSLSAQIRHIGDNIQSEKVVESKISTNRRSLFGDFARGWEFLRKNLETQEELHPLNTHIYTYLNWSWRSNNIDTNTYKSTQKSYSAIERFTK